MKSKLASLKSEDKKRLNELHEKIETLQMK
jgi:hypothetical protein